MCGTLLAKIVIVNNTLTPADVAAMPLALTGALVLGKQGSRQTITPIWLLARYLVVSGLSPLNFHTAQVFHWIPFTGSLSGSILLNLKALAAKAFFIGALIYSRRSYSDGANSMFDYPMASRFDETDSLLVYEDVFVPRENVFVYKDIDVARAQWFEDPAHVLENNQAQTRFVTKLRFMVGLAQKIAEMNGVANLPPVQSLIGDLALHAATYEGLLDAQISKAEPNQNGVYVPNKQITYAAIAQQSRMYPEFLDIIRALTGGGFIQLPSSVRDFENPTMNAVIQKYIQSPDMPADDRVKFMKLAWDCVGSEFAPRHTSYEKFYAGAPFIVKSHLYREYDFAKSQALVETALASYDKTGRIDLPTSVIAAS